MSSRDNKPDADPHPQSICIYFSRHSSKYLIKHKQIFSGCNLCDYRLQVYKASSNLSSTYSQFLFFTIHIERV